MAKVKHPAPKARLNFAELRRLATATSLRRSATQASPACPPARDDSGRPGSSAREATPRRARRRERSRGSGSLSTDGQRRVVLKLGDDISTDIIYPGRFMATVLPAETPQHAFADYAEFNKKLQNKEIPVGSIIAADKNFGCGSSREQAASCLKGYELTVIAKNFSRIFLQNAINLGLNVIICPGIEAQEDDDLEIHGGEIINHTSGKIFQIKELPRARQAIINAGGLINYARQLLLERRKS